MWAQYTELGIERERIDVQGDVMMELIPMMRETWGVENKWMKASEKKKKVKSAVFAPFASPRPALTP